MASAEDLCPRPLPPPPLPTRPHAPPIWPASVWECESPQQADAILSGNNAGYVYQRDGHPNAWLLAEKLKLLHGAQAGVVTSSGMAALSAALLSQLKAGDHAVVGSRVYGKTLSLFGGEARRLGISLTKVDTCDLAAVEKALQANTKLVVAETIANPLLEVADIAALAELAHRKNVPLLVDNTFASPILCRPLELGADLVMESLTKALNGHSDVILGFLGGREDVWERVPAVISTWGLTSSPLDCWLASRGLATAHLRIDRACENAIVAAEFLQTQKPKVAAVFFPSLAEHPQHELARRQFGERFGTIVTFRLAGGRAAADSFIAAAKRIPFCPSLGELSTTLSHPETTSHRGLSAEDREALGINGGTIRLSVGTESSEFVREALAEGLAGVAAQTADDMEIDLHDERLAALARELRAGEGECPFVVRPPHDATVRLAHFSAGRDATYVVVQSMKPIKASIGYAKFVEGTTLIYDATDEMLQGKARPFECELDSEYPRIYGLLPVQIESNHVALRGRRLEIEFRDARGERIEAALPFELTLTGAGGRTRVAYFSTTREGRFVRQLAAGEEILPIVVRSLLTGWTKQIAAR